MTTVVTAQQAARLITPGGTEDARRRAYGRVRQWAARGQLPVAGRLAGRPLYDAEAVLQLDRASRRGEPLAQALAGVSQ